MFLTAKEKKRIEVRRISFSSQDVFKKQNINDVIEASKDQVMQQMKDKV